MKGAIFNTFRVMAAGAGGGDAVSACRNGGDYLTTVLTEVARAPETMRTT